MLADFLDTLEQNSYKVLAWGELKHRVKKKIHVPCAAHSKLITFDDEIVEVGRNPGRHLPNSS